MSFAIMWGTWAVVMSLVMGWLARRHLRKDTASNQHVLTYPLIFLIVGIACATFFLALTVFALYLRVFFLSPVIWFIPAASCLGAVIIVMYVRVRHTIEPSGLRYQTLISGRGFIRWNDVSRVSYIQLSKQFFIYGTVGEGVGISIMLVSLPEFAHAVLQNVPPERIDANALNLLEQMAAG